MQAWPNFEGAVFRIAIETVEDLCRVSAELPKVRKEAPPKLGLPGDHQARMGSTLDKTLLMIECNALSDRLKCQLIYFGQSLSSSTRN